MTDKELSKLVTDYLIYSCMYYELNCSDITDAQYDKLSHAIRDNWDKINHYHKHLIDIESLKESTSGYYLEYPSIVRSTACDKAKKHPESPMFGRDTYFINSYICQMMKPRIMV